MINVHGCDVKMQFLCHTAGKKYFYSYIVIIAHNDVYVTIMYN